MNIIGNKNKFAIEYSIVFTKKKTAYGDCIIWLEGKCLGGLEGECYLNMICQWLERQVEFKDNLFFTEDLYKLSSQELFNFMEEKAEYEIKENYRFLDTEGFDLFRSYIYRKDDKFNFIWQLDRDYWEEFKAQDVSIKLFTATVDIKIYCDIIFQFKNALLERYNLNSLNI